MSALKGKRIVLGVTGGIGAYKAAELIRLFVKEGAEVHPVMTRAATEFITPLTLSTLSRNPARTTFFSEMANGEESSAAIPHIELADSADLILIAPATANIIGKIAGGIADDILTTLVLAAKGPLIIAPAMNHRMWDNPTVKENVEKLKGFGYHFVGPGEGELACGYEGRGRLADLEEIVEASASLLSPKDLFGARLLVTAGPTREPLDPVRFFTNASSGKMGYEIAKEAKRRGAAVTLVSGATSLAPPDGVRFIPVRTAEEMHEAAFAEFEDSTIAIMVAAVSDFTPATRSNSKVKKEDAALSVEMRRTRDILKELGERKDGRVLVGFALETENLKENATKKLKEKELDMVVANSTHSLGGDSTECIIITPDGKCEAIGPASKREAAEAILERAASLKVPELLN